MCIVFRQGSIYIQTDNYIQTDTGASNPLVPPLNMSVRSQSGGWTEGIHAAVVCTYTAPMCMCMMFHGRGLSLDDISGVFTRYADCSFVASYIMPCQ